MKNPVIKVAEWMLVIGVACVLIGSLLPFVGWEFMGDSEYINFYMTVGEIGEYIWAGIMIGALVMTMITGILIEDSTNMGTSICMVIAALAGEIGYRYYVSEANYIFFQFGFGKVLMEGAYIVLIVAAFIALGGDIHYFFIKESVKEITNVEYKCPKCGLVSIGKSKFCSRCGFLIKRFTCPNCGAERTQEAQFCKECGEKLPILTENKD